MSNNRRMSFDLPTNEANTVIEVVVRYSKPDNSYINDRAESQGYWVSIVPVKIEGSFRITTVYSGEKSFYEGAKRFNRNRLESILSQVRFDIKTGHVRGYWPDMARRVAESNGLHITQWDTAIEIAKNLK